MYNKLFVLLAFALRICAQECIVEPVSVIPNSAHPTKPGQWTEVTIRVNNLRSQDCGAVIPWTIVPTNGAIQSADSMDKCLGGCRSDSPECNELGGDNNTVQVSVTQPTYSRSVSPVSSQARHDWDPQSVPFFYAAYHMRQTTQQAPCYYENTLHNYSATSFSPNDQERMTSFPYALESYTGAFEPGTWERLLSPESTQPVRTPGQYSQDVVSFSSTIRSKLANTSLTQRILNVTELPDVFEESYLTYPINPNATEFELAAFVGPLCRLGASDWENVLGVPVTDGSWKWFHCGGSEQCSVRCWTCANYNQYGTHTYPTLLIARAPSCSLYRVDPPDTASDVAEIESVTVTVSLADAPPSVFTFDALSIESVDELIASTTTVNPNDWVIDAFIKSNQRSVPPPVVDPTDSIELMNCYGLRQKLTAVVQETNPYEDCPFCVPSIIDTQKGIMFLDRTRYSASMRSSCGAMNHAPSYWRQFGASNGPMAYNRARQIIGSLGNSSNLSAEQASLIGESMCRPTGTCGPGSTCETPSPCSIISQELQWYRFLQNITAEGTPPACGRKLLPYSIANDMWNPLKPNLWVNSNQMPANETVRFYWQDTFPPLQSITRGTNFELKLYASKNLETTTAPDPLPQIQFLDGPNLITYECSPRSGGVFSDVAIDTANFRVVNAVPSTTGDYDYYVSVQCGVLDPIDNPDKKGVECGAFVEESMAGLESTLRTVETDEFRLVGIEIYTPDTPETEFCTRYVAFEAGTDEDSIGIGPVEETLYFTPLQCILLKFEVLSEDINNSSNSVTMFAKALQKETIRDANANKWYISFTGGIVKKTLGSPVVSSVCRALTFVCPEPAFTPPPPVPTPNPIPQPPVPITTPSPTPQYNPPPAPPLPPVPIPPPVPQPDPVPPPQKSESLFTRCTDSGDIINCIEILLIGVGVLVGIIICICIVFCIVSSQVTKERKKVTDSISSQSVNTTPGR